VWYHRAPDTHCCKVVGRDSPRGLTHATYPLVIGGRILQACLLSTCGRRYAPAIRFRCTLAWMVVHCAVLARAYTRWEAVVGATAAAWPLGDRWMLRLARLRQDSR
jgi:hypothetical protein